MARTRSSPLPVALALALLALPACGRSDLLDDLAGSPAAGDDGGAGDATTAGDGAPPDSTSDATVPDFTDDATAGRDSAPVARDSGPPPPRDAAASPCNASTCPDGCCGPGGECVTGTADVACGAEGSVCFDCTAIGQQCAPLAGRGGACAVSAVCTPATCVGCCDGETCVKNVSPQQCGSYGQACQACAPGDLCKGTCARPQLDCGPANCAGCCDNGNICHVGTSDVACGSAGAACSRCVPLEGTGQCIANAGGSGGTCTTQICDARTCGIGCCAGGACVTGDAPGACGRGGGACQACGPNETCAGNACVPKPGCSPATCAGCCSNDTCMPGALDGYCGAGGFDCVNCTAFKQSCVNGTCVVPVACSPATCRGCCYGDVCAEGDQDFLCGAGGQICASCRTTGQHCDAGVCM